MESWRKNGIQAPPALYWIQRYNGARYIGVTVYQHTMHHQCPQHAKPIGLLFFMLTNILNVSYDPSLDYIPHSMDHILLNT